MRLRRIGLVAVAVGISLTQAGASSANHEGIVLYTPPLASSVYSNKSVQFTWYSPHGHANGSFEYFQVARDPAFTDYVINVEFVCAPSSTCPQETTRGPFVEGTYYWRVRWHDGSSQLRTSDIWSFTSVAPPPPPTTQARRRSRARPGEAYH
jgi:hypothetical protein